MLNEDQNERADFDAQVEAIYCGDPLLAVQSILTTFARTAPERGSYAKIVAICASEVEKARSRLKPPNGEVRGASRPAGEASSAEGASSTVVLGDDI